MIRRLYLYHHRNPMQSVHSKLHLVCFVNSLSSNSPSKNDEPAVNLGTSTALVWLMWFRLVQSGMINHKLKSDLLTQLCIPLRLF